MLLQLEGLDIRKDPEPLQFAVLTPVTRRLLHPPLICRPILQTPSPNSLSAVRRLLTPTSPAAVAPTCTRSIQHRRFLDTHQSLNPKLVEESAASATSEQSQSLIASSDRTATTPSSEEHEDCGCSRCNLDGLTEMSFADPTSDTALTAFRAIDDGLRRENVARMEDGRFHLQEATLKEIIASRCDEWVEMRYVESRRQSRSQDPATPKAHEQSAQVGSILDSKRIGGRLYYRVRWQGYPPEYDSWEPLTHIDTLNLVEDFHRRYPSRPGAPWDFSVGWAWWM
jgi:hypothetical protein